ncbi:GNAT family N-acetyltransferase [Thermosyntropha sp.]|uniref:GNAT family N-acetyltransferase n=1 Tax=Thermosyntropha sp. TaxID=2740820 RepID=UPI0025D19CFE|nr:GNAT family N-acetyltransferase [Thermosyntropha sp.]MBO8159076.1 GNAT family N-acetyltransferase [Thermosyntropha sp.]
MDIHFRLVQEEDCDLLYKWANDPVVRENSFNKHFISYDEHKKWFYEKINSPKCLFFIVISFDQPVGQIRLDIEEDTAIINYSVDKNYRGRGYGTQILINIVQVIKEYNIPVNRIVGKVKLSNIASQKAFKKAGYSEKRFKDYIEYSKDI